MNICSACLNSSRAEEGARKQQQSRGRREKGRRVGAAAATRQQRQPASRHPTRSLGPHAGLQLSLCVRQAAFWQSMLQAGAGRQAGRALWAGGVRPPRHASSINCTLPAPSNPCTAPHLQYCASRALHRPQRLSCAAGWPQWQQRMVPSGAGRLAAADCSACSTAGTSTVPPRDSCWVSRSARGAVFSMLSFRASVQACEAGAPRECWAKRRQTV